MRLGGYCYRPETIDELDRIAASLDRCGLAAIPAPARIAEMSDDEARAFGLRAEELDIVIGEAFPMVNLMVDDRAKRDERIDQVRTTLQKAELMGCRGVGTVVGSVADVDRIPAIHPYMFTDECRAEYRDVILRIVDGLELTRTRVLIEPWHNSFFYRPESILRFLEDIGDERVALHLDQMNMVDQDTYFDTTALIDVTFDVLAPYVGSVHFKDIKWDWTHFVMKLDEVLIGDGVLDYDTYLRRLSDLDPDLTCYCEHLSDESQYLDNFSRLHSVAGRVGVEFSPRAPKRLDNARGVAAR